MRHAMLFLLFQFGSDDDTRLLTQKFMLYLFSQRHFTAVTPAEQPRATNYTINLHGFPENSCTNAQIQLTDKNEHFAHFQIFGKELPPALWDHQKTNKTQLHLNSRTRRRRIDCSHVCGVY